MWGPKAAPREGKPDSSSGCYSAALVNQEISAPATMPCISNSVNSEQDKITALEKCTLSAYSWHSSRDPRTGRVVVQRGCSVGVWAESPTWPWCGAALRPLGRPSPRFSPAGPALTLGFWKLYLQPFPLWKAEQGHTCSRLLCWIPPETTEGTRATMGRVDLNLSLN